MKLTKRQKLQIIARFKKIYSEVDDDEILKEMRIFITWAAKPIIDEEIMKCKMKLRGDINKVTLKMINE